MKTPRGIDLDQYRTQAKELLKSCRNGDPAALQRFREHHPAHSKIVDSGEIKLSHTQLVVARENGFSSWKTLSDYVLFRQAVEALDHGDVPRLAKLLDEHPSLIHYRCRHGEPYEQGYFAGATLLNHIAGNPFRAPIPPNILEIAHLLLDRGARDEEPKPRYTIGLLLTSKAASEAGVALPLIDLIVEKTGASIDFRDPQVLNAPLGNHAPETAQALIQRGAPMDVRHAAALGRLDLVSALVEGKPLTENVSPLGPNRERDIQQAFLAACANNHTEIAEYLLDAGVDPAASAGTGQPGLHTAVYSGSLETVQMLLRRKAPMEIENEYGGTALGQALWSYENEPHRNFPAIIAALVRAGAVVRPQWAAMVERILSGESEASIWKAAEAAIVSGDAETLARLMREHESLFREGTPPDYGTGGLRPSFQGTAEEIVVRENQFESWPALEEFIKERSRAGSPISRFEEAVDAVVTGDEQTLQRLISDDPALIQARSARPHRATLLNYVGANGVESFRQKTPKNSVRIAEILLEAGAEVDSIADIYGGSATLGLIATSIHPLKAGVQNALIELFLTYGAKVDGGFEESNQGGYTGGAVIGCLRNGRGDAAVLLAKRGARVDLEGAAGIGRLDLVKSYFDSQGGLIKGATEKQKIDGFAWACEFGRTKVAEFLLSMGVPVDARLPHHGQIGLHWTANGGHVETAKMLLSHDSPVSTKDVAFGGTPIDWAIYGLIDQPNKDSLYAMVELLRKAGGVYDPAKLTEEKVATDTRLVEILTSHV